MRRKSTRNIKKVSPEKEKQETPKTRRQSRRRKKSPSSDSEDETIRFGGEHSALQITPDTTTKSHTPSDDECSKELMWKVTPSEETAKGELQKLKICLRRPSPESPIKTRRSKSNSHTEDDNSSEDILPRRTRSHGSPHIRTDGLSIQQEHNKAEIEDMEETKGKGKSKGKHKSKIEKHPHLINEPDIQTNSEISENVQVTAQSPTIDIPVDNDADDKQNTSNYNEEIKECQEIIPSDEKQLEIQTILKNETIIIDESANEKQDGGCIPDVVTNLQIINVPPQNHESVIETEKSVVGEREEEEKDKETNAIIIEEQNQNQLTTDNNSDVDSKITALKPSVEVELNDDTVEVELNDEKETVDDKKLGELKNENDEKDLSNSVSDQTKVEETNIIIVMEQETSSEIIADKQIENLDNEETKSTSEKINEPEIVGVIINSENDDDDDDKDNKIESEIIVEDKENLLKQSEVVTADDDNDNNPIKNDDLKESTDSEGEEEDKLNNFKRNLSETNKEKDQINNNENKVLTEKLLDNNSRSPYEVSLHGSSNNGLTVSRKKLIRDLKETELNSDTNHNKNKLERKKLWKHQPDYVSSLIKVDLETIKIICPYIEFPEEHELHLDVQHSYKKQRKPSIDITTTTVAASAAVVTTTTTTITKPERKVSVEYKSSEGSSPEKIQQYEQQISMNSSIIEDEDNSNIIAFNRKISIVDDSASKLRPPPSPAKNPLSEVLFISNLVRPFTLKQLKELLERMGKIKEDGFWTDRIKSKCYVCYESIEEAEATRNALHGVHWPVGNGKKLIIEYATLEDLDKAKNPPPSSITETKVIEKENLELSEKLLQNDEKKYRETNRKPTDGAAVREWDVGKKEIHEERSSRERIRKHRRSASPQNDFIARKQRKLEETIPQKLMDDLFSKTKATPSIYWLPLSPEEISTKQQQRLIRMEEHKRRMEENSRAMGRDAGRGASYRRRYD